MMHHTEEVNKVFRMSNRLLFWNGETSKIFGIIFNFIIIIGDMILI
jgi:hypothetical protein